VTAVARRPMALVVFAGIVMVLSVGAMIVPLTVPASGAAGGGGDVLPQIAVTDITFSDVTPKEGQNITITVVIYNNWSIPVSNVSVAILYDRTNITTVPNLTVPAKGNLTIDVPWKAVKFTHTMSAIPYVNDLQIQKTPKTAQLTVAATPIGNAYVVFAALVVVLLVFLAAVAAPSVWEHMRGK